MFGHFPAQIDIWKDDMSMLLITSLLVVAILLLVLLNRMELLQVARRPEQRKLDQVLAEAAEQPRRDRQ